MPDSRVRTPGEVRAGLRRAAFSAAHGSDDLRAVGRYLLGVFEAAPASDAVDEVLVRLAMIREEADHLERWLTGAADPTLDPPATPVRCRVDPDD